MIPDVPPSCRQAVWGLPGKGFASGRKYLNSSNESTSTDRPRPSPIHLHTWPPQHPVVMDLVILCPQLVSKAGLK